MREGSTGACVIPNELDPILRLNIPTSLICNRTLVSVLARNGIFNVRLAEEKKTDDRGQ